MRVLFVVLISSMVCYANAQTSISLEEAVSEVEASQLKFKGKIKLFNYLSTESCIYLNEDIIIIEHYCGPRNNYPARSITIISHDFGRIDFYEENRGAYTNKSITLSSFPKDLMLDFPGVFHHLSPKEINRILESQYRRYLPACWASINTDRKPRLNASCYEESPDNHKPWLKEASSYVVDTALWDKLYERLLEPLK